MRFRVKTTGGLPSYVSLVANNTIGVLESAEGARLALNGNNTTPNVQGPNDNDPAQKIQFIQTGNGYLLQRNGTNYALSSNTLDYVNNNQNGLAMTTYTTGGGRWQNFGFVNAGNGYYNIKWQFNPNYCVSAGQPGNLQVALIVPCSGDLRQRFRVSSNYIVSTQVTNYEAWVVRADPLKVVQGIPSGSPDVGHAFVALIKDSYTLQKRYSNIGTLIDQTIIDRIATVQSTYSYWPDLNSKNNNSTDLANANDILTTGGIQNKIYGVRRIRISENFANGMLNKSNSTKCSGNYGTHWNFSPGPLGVPVWTELNQCTCVDQSVFLWKSITGEDMGYTITPDQITQWIIDKNALDTGYANNGNTLP